MIHEFSAPFSNFVLSLSDAIDIASPDIALHQMRTAFIAWKIARAAGLSEREINNIYLAAIFHDIGALSLEDKTRLHAGQKNIDVNAHCILGEELFTLSSLLRPSARIVRHHHRTWRSWDEPIGNPDVMGAQTVFLADTIERSIQRNEYILHQVDDIRSGIASLAGPIMHEDIVDVFMRISEHEDFWLDMVSPRLYSLLLHHGPFRKNEIFQKDIFSVASIFRHLVDFKSRFTATHSTGVAQCAVMLSRHLGFTDSETTQMEIAGYFHDLGKLAVPNSVLEKPGRLTKREFEIIKQHTYFTYTVLSTIGGLDLIAEWAAFHHEKLDGSGYPFHVRAEKINIGARIMAVADIFTALLENRPYRSGMTLDQIERILSAQVANHALDKLVVDILLDNFKGIAGDVMACQKESETLFEMKFAKIKKQASSAPVA